jgi:hypothetical protein
MKDLKSNFNAEIDQIIAKVSNTQHNAKKKKKVHGYVTGETRKQRKKMNAKVAKKSTCFVNCNV